MQYESLLRWLFSEVILQANGSLKPSEELLALCHRIDACSQQIGFVPEYLACGIEFHHDASGRIDYGILVDSDQPAISAATSVPSWWSYLIARVEQDDPFLPSRYSMEFDSQRGQAPVLAGIFQAVQPPAQTTKRERRRLISQLIAHLGRLEFPREALENSRCLQICLDQLGIPEQVGIMSGRGDLIKLVLKVSRSPAQSLRTFLFCLQQGQQHPWPEITDESLLSALASTEISPIIRLSVDINLAQDRFLPRLGIEVANTMPQQGGIPLRLLDFCRQTIGIDTANLASFEALLGQLPVGYRRRPKQGLTRIIGRSERHDHLRTANLSHVKIVLHPRRRPLLKSYIEAQHILIRPSAEASLKAA